MDYFNKKKAPEEVKPKENWRLKEWFSDLKDEELNKLKLFNSEVIKYNSTLNLISEKTIPFSDAIHFSDCILASREIVKEGSLTSVSDIGLGNGFPSVILSILYPQIKITVFDKDPRKVEYINHISKLLDQKNLEGKLGGIDTISAGALDFVIMRAPTAISKAILALRKQVKKGGALYMLKSEEWATEVANIPSQLCSFWLPSLVAEYRLPIGEVKFAVVKLKKIAD